MVSTASSRFYDFDRVLSFDAMYNFIIGGRGIGKTYGAIKSTIKRCIKRDEEFIYLRRYKDELSTARQNFFTEMVHEFPEYEFRVNGNIGEYRPRIEEGDVDKDGKGKKGLKWKRIVYFIPLSTTQANKSTAYPKVTRIIFDEFIIEKGAVHYIQDEARVFNNFYSTVDRWKDKTKVLFLANSVSITNPYFVDFGIDPDAGEFVVKNKGFIVCHFVDSTEFMNMAAKTRFGQFIEGSEYAEFAMSNTFKDNDDRLLGKKVPNAAYLYSLKLSKHTISIWRDVSGMYYAQEKQPGNPLMFTVHPDMVDTDVTLFIRSDKLMMNLRSAFRHGRMMFESAQIRNALLEIFKY